MGGHCPFFVLVAVKEGDTRVFEHLAILLAAMASHNAITRWLLPTGKPSLGGANIVLTGNRDASTSYSGTPLIRTFGFSIQGTYSR